MEHNPYTPPQAKTDEPTRREVVSRPVSVWVSIIFLLLFDLMFFVATLRFMANMSSDNNGGSIVVPVVALVWRLALVASFTAGAYGAFRRQVWSRWFGVVMVTAFAAFMFFGTDTTQYANDAERSGGTIARVLVPVLLVWLACTLTFSSKVKKYFSTGSDET